MITAYELAIIAAGIFFLNGLITGVWKYLEIKKSPKAQAHPYVDIAHRASLLYSFAALLLAKFIEISELSEGVELIATSLLVAYFAMAIISYMVQGFLKQTDNQLKPVTPLVNGFMWTLVIAEIGGFVVLFYGVIVALLSN